MVIFLLYNDKFDVDHNIVRLDGVECWAEDMHLQFNQTNKSSSNAEGVEMRVPGWGTTYGMEYIDSSWTAWILGNIGIYIAYLVRGTVK